MLTDSVLALLLGSLWLLPMPDGSGPILPIAAERLARLGGGGGRLAAMLALDERQLLRSCCVHHHRSRVIGPKSLAAAANGSLLALDRTGVLVRADPDGGGGFALQAAVSYVGPGRPLGIEANGAGESERLLIADSLKGLVELPLAGGARARGLRVLSNGAAYTNDLARDAQSGAVYFSSSTREPVAYAHEAFGAGHYDTMAAFYRVMLRGDASGRLLRYEPESGATEELLDGLWFANGVALSASADFVLVVETLGLRVLRLWLAGPRAGEVEDFASELPGFPDGISRSADGETFWLSIVAPWTPLVKLLRFRPVRGLLARAIPLMRRLSRPIGLVLRLRAADGAIVGALSDADGGHVWACLR